MKTLMNFARLALVILACTLFALPVTADHDRPWIGAISGDESGAPLTGQASHFGACMIDATVEFVGPGLFVGSGTLTAANGDEVHLSLISFQFPTDPPEELPLPIPFTGTIVVDGGTGRFEGANGSANFAGLQDYPGGPFTFTWAGTISY